jgi:hypothetical protein
MGAGDRDLKRKEASMSKTESGDDNLKKIQVQAMALLATKPALAGARKKRKKLVKTRLPQELVDEIMRRPVTHFPVIPDELVAGFSEECRAAFAMQKAEELMAVDADIVRQYKDNGYAEVEEEVIDNEQGKVED